SRPPPGARANWPADPCPGTAAPAGLHSVQCSTAEEAAMARKPARAKAETPARPTGRARDRNVAAFPALLAEKSFEKISLGEIATRAGVSLGAMRAEFGSTLAIYAAHIKAIDRAVLDGGEGDMAEEPPRERLFDVLMRRIELLAPHKEALRS